MPRPLQFTADMYALFNNHHTVMLIIDPDNGSIMDANPAACTFYGRSSELITTMHLNDLEPPHPGQSPDSTRQAVTPAGTVAITRHISAHGIVREVEIRISPLDLDGKALYFAIIIDRSECNKSSSTTHITDEFQNKSHHMLEALAQQVPCALFLTVITPEGHISTPYSSKRLHDIYEICPDEIRTNINAISDRFHPEDRQRIFDSIYRACRSLSVWTCEYRVNLPLQGQKWLYGVAQPAKQADGSIEFYGIIMDITERKRVEESLKNSEEQFIEAFKKCPLLMAISTLDNGCYIEVNDLFLDTLELQRDQVVGFTSRELGLFADPTQRDQIISKVHQHGFVTNSEIYIKKPSGGLLYGLFSAQTIELQQQQYLLTTFIDFSDRKQSEEDLRDSEERYRRLFEMESDSVVMLDIPSGKFLDVNSAAISMYGYSKQEFLTLRHIDISAEPDLTLQAILSNDPQTPLRWHKKKNGTVFPVEIKGSNFDFKGREVHVAAIRDISERVKAEKSLIELNQKLQSLSEHAQQVQENERFAIARDIHDEIGQSLTVMKLDLEWIENRVTSSSVDLLEHVQEMRKNIEQLSIKVQQIASNLRPPLLDQVGLVAAIECHVNEIVKRSPFECFLMLNEDIDQIDKSTATAIMRIVQEGLTNIVRHADASEVSISLCKTGSELILEISDDGRGISPEQISSSSSFGIMGMRERVRICHGDLQIRSLPFKGTTLYITIPFNSGEENI